jgi:hypothetical protein
LQSIGELVAYVARILTEEEKVKRNIHGIVYALCIIHCCRNAKITKSNIRTLCVQWAKTANLEDQLRKVQQLLTAGITTEQWTHMKDNWKSVTYLGLKESQNLVTNHEVVSNNMGEQNNNRIKKIGTRSMAPVDHTLKFLTDMASTFVFRLARAQSYATIHHELVCLDVLQKTLEGAEVLHSQRWTVLVVNAHCSTGLAGSATEVTYSVSQNDSVSPRNYNVTLRFQPDKPWFENIECVCNRTKAYGRPCYHASLCLVHPCITDVNAFVRDANKFSYKLRCWYSPVYYVSTMIQQYSACVKIPSFGELSMYALFPPRIMALAGLFELKSYIP